MPSVATLPRYEELCSVPGHGHVSQCASHAEFSFRLWIMSLFVNCILYMFFLLGGSFLETTSGKHWAGPKVNTLC